MREIGIKGEGVTHAGEVFRGSVDKPDYHVDGPGQEQSAPGGQNRLR
jgi:hypothetical protein